MPFLTLQNYYYLTDQDLEAQRDMEAWTMETNASGVLKDKVTFPGVLFTTS